MAIKFVRMDSGRGREAVVRLQDRCKAMVISRPWHRRTKGSLGYDPERAVRCPVYSLDILDVQLVLGTLVLCVRGAKEEKAAEVMADVRYDMLIFLRA